MLVASEHAERELTDLIDISHITKYEWKFSQNPSMLRGLFEMKVLKFLRYPITRWIERDTLPDGVTLDWPAFSAEELKRRVVASDLKSGKVSVAANVRLCLIIPGNSYEACLRLRGYKMKDDEVVQQFDQEWRRVSSELKPEIGMLNEHRAELAWQMLRDKESFVNPDDCTVAQQLLKNAGVTSPAMLSFTPADLISAISIMLKVAPKTLLQSVSSA